MESLKPNKWKSLDTFLTSLVNKHQTPSVNYLLFDQEKTLHSFQAGLANIKNQKAVNDHTTYHAFSATKNTPTWGSAV